MERLLREVGLSQLPPVTLENVGESPNMSATAQHGSWAMR